MIGNAISTRCWGNFIKNKANYTKSFLITSNKAAFFLGKKIMFLGNTY